MRSPIKVLIVDDSMLVRSLLKQGLGTFGDVEVIGTASDPYEARDFIEKHQPDVITLDVEMPKMNGLEFLRHLMAQMPTPVVMVSSLTERGQQVTLDALSYGAVDFVAKPQANEPNAFSVMVKLLHSKILVASRAILRKHVSNTGFNPTQQTTTHPSTTFKKNTLVAIGASTGGTEAIKEIIPHLPSNFPPVVITQHMPKGFTSLFAQRLNTISKISVIEATDGQQLLPGTAFIAPGGKQMKVIRKNDTMYISVTESDLVNGHRPSVEYLFDSLLETRATISAALLTGMGKDGSNALLRLKQGGIPTIAQDEKSCVVFGMPAEAIRIGGASIVLPITEIAQTLIQQVKE